MATTPTTLNNTEELESDVILESDTNTEVIETESVTEPSSVESFNTAVFSPETFSTELVTNTVRLSGQTVSGNESAAVRRQRLRLLGYI